MLKRMILFLIIANMGISVVAMSLPWKKKKEKKSISSTQISPADESYKVYYFEALNKLPTQWPNDPIEQSNLTSRISDFARDFLNYPHRQKVEELVTARINSDEFNQEELRKKRAVLEIALRRYGM